MTRAEWRNHHARSQARLRPAAARQATDAGQPTAWPAAPAIPSAPTAPAGCATRATRSGIGGQGRDDGHRPTPARRERIWRPACHRAHRVRGDLWRLLDEHAALTDLLREYAKKGADIVDPVPASLIGRTRALLAQLDA